MSIVSEHLPALNRLRISMFDQRFQLNFQHQEHSGEDRGLKTLSIETDMDIWDEEIAEDIRLIIKKYHNTLEYLDWTMDKSRIREALEHLLYPRLKKLAISSSGWQIVRNAPLLEESKLTSRVIIKHPQVLDMIPPHLKS